MNEFLAIRKNFQLLQISHHPKLWTSLDHIRDYHKKLKPHQPQQANIIIKFLHQTEKIT